VFALACIDWPHDRDTAKIETTCDEGHAAIRLARL